MRKPILQTIFSVFFFCVLSRRRYHRDVAEKLNSYRNVNHIILNCFLFKQYLICSLPSFVFVNGSWVVVFFKTITCLSAEHYNPESKQQNEYCGILKCY